MSILGGIAGNLAGGNIGRAVVSLVLDTTGYTANLEKAKVETVSATKTSGSAFSNFSGVATAAYATAAVAVIDFAKEAVQAASEHEQVIAALTAQVGDNITAFEDQATALQNLSGFQDEAILGADTILARFKLTQQQIQDTIPTVLDYARATGKTVPDAATTIGKALLGNTRALKAVGISYTSTGDAAKDFVNIQNLLNQKLGGQAAAFADTFAGKMEILSAKFDDVKEAVGTGLLDDLTALADDVNILAALFDKFGEAMTGATGGLFDLNDALNMPGLQFISQGLAFLDEKFHLTEEDSYNLTEAVAGVKSGLQGMSQEAYNAAVAAAHLSNAQKDLKDAVNEAGDGILSLTTTVKDTFDISQREMDKGFHQMLATAVRFKRDMTILENLDVGLSPNKTAQFEQFLISQGPAYVDRFVRSSQQKQDQWVSSWERSVGAINHATSGIQPVNIQVNSSQLDLAAARATRLQQQLDRLA